MAVSEILRAGVVNPPREFVGLTADTKPTDPMKVSPWSTFRELDGQQNIWEWQSTDGVNWSWQLL